MKKLNPFLFIILLLIPLFGCRESEQLIKPSDETIKIGIIGPMSGQDKAMGLEGLEGIKTALHLTPLLNNGDSIKLIVGDDKNQPELTVKAFKKLVTIDNVSAVLLLSTSASALAVNSIADKYHTPVLVLLATHQDISKETDFVSQSCFDNSLQGKVAALFVRDELLIDRVAVFNNPKSFYSKSLADEFVKKFNLLEGKVVDVISIDSETVDYPTILSHLREQKVQLLYLPVAADHVINISTTLQDLDWHPDRMGGDGLLTTVLAQHQEKIDYLDGFLAIDLYSSTLAITSTGKKATKAFRSLFKTRDSTFPAAGFEGISLLFQAMNRCSNPEDRQCINNKIRNTVDFEGLMGKITIQSNGKAMRPLIVNRIRGNKLESVVKVY